MPSLWSGFSRPVFLVFALALAPVSGVPTPAPTRDFEVDTSDRSAVVSFYQAIYMASEGYRDRIGWTGSYSSLAAGAEGSVSTEFAGDVERRINFYRALCGVKAGVRVNSGATVRIAAGDPWVPPADTTKAAAAQRAALMIIRTYPGNGGLSHDPPPGAIAWTPAAWNANRNGNLSLGFFGPAAVDAYFKEDVSGISSWNADVGHRRWLLFQGATDFATGDTPGSFSPDVVNGVRPPTNVMYVIPKSAELDFSPEPVFAAFPSAGYFPARLNASFWSLSYPGADFSAATVSLKDAALNPVAVSIVSRRSGFGDPSIVWQVPAAAAAKAVGGDRTWQVDVSNIGGAGVPAQHSYQVTLIDPDRLNEVPLVTGDPEPQGHGSVYTVSGVAGADAMEAGVFRRRAADWSEGAEDSPASTVVDGSDKAYPLRAAIPGYQKSGAKAFRLTFPTRYDPVINGVPEQSFELGRELVPGAGATVNFQLRRGLMTAASKLAVEVSTDEGLSWSVLGTPSSGIGGAGDPAFQAVALPLPAALSPVRVRFRYYLADPTSALFAHEDYPTQATGVFIDDIAASGCDWLERTGGVAGPGLATVTLDAETAGAVLASGQEWWLRARAILGGKAFPYGPAMRVRPSGPLELSGPARPPASGADYTLVPDLSADSYQLEVAALGSAVPWTEGAESIPAPQVSSEISASYALASNLKGFRKSGALAFRLGLSSLADEEDHFTVERTVVPTAASTLEFWVRRGPLSVSNRLHVELSDDGGASWVSIWNLAGLKKADRTMTLRSLPLAAWAERPVKLRFALRKDPGGVNLKWNAKRSGVWIDDITVTAPSPVLTTLVSPVAGNATQVRLDSVTAGPAIKPGATLRLRLRAVTAAGPGPWGPALTVEVGEPVEAAEAAVAGFAGWLPELGLSFEGDADHDGLPNGIEYAFSLDPTDGLRIPDRLIEEAGNLELSRELPDLRDDLIYGAEWSEDLKTWSAEGVAIRFEDGRIHAGVARGEGRRFLRWNVVAR